MEETKKTKNNIFIPIIIALVVLAITIVIGLLIGNNKNSDNTENDKPYKPNKVVLDGFTYSPLKLELNDSNLVYSPLSIKYALSMLSEGAKGDTKEEIDKLIKNLGITKYEDIDKVLSLANSIFIRDLYKEEVYESFTNTLKEKYNAEVIYDQFENAQNINKWIENKTFGIIKDMLNDSLVQNKSVKLFLINALAIDMEWLDRFEQENTSSKPFTKVNGEKIDVAMMHKTSETNKYYQDEDYSVLSMPFKDYNGTNLEFISIMPNKGDLKEFLLKDDVNESITNLLDKMHTPENVELSISIPRFAFDFKTSLKEDLRQMGIKKVFEADADFTNIANTGLYVNDVLHKADIKCSEKGVKAAAATVIVFKDTVAYEPVEKEKVYFNFNKPFMFVIRDTETNEVWFVGTVFEPLLWENVKDDYKYE